MKRMLFLATMIVVLLSPTMAQVDDVTLVVSGEGTTKDEATVAALRNAIEQAFGVFVSANTEILNDVLVKDEIATISSGNVKKYTELGVLTKANGKTEVSLQATVSVQKLTSYAKSHGSSAEFAGATFAANMKLIELNKQNSIKAFNNLFKQIYELKKDIYDCTIEVGMPQQNGEVDVTLNYYTNENTGVLGNLVVSTLAALAIPKDVVNSLKDQGVRLYRYVIPKYYDESSPLYPYAILEKYERCLYFYAPITPTNVVNRNNDNGYTGGRLMGSLSRNTPEHSDDDYDIAIIGRTYNIYDNLNNNYYLTINRTNSRNERVRTQEEAFRLGGICFKSEIGYSGGVLVDRGTTHYYGEAIEITSGNTCEYISRGYKFAYDGPFICIPSYFIKKHSKQKKSRGETSSFVPELIISIPGTIFIPQERINSISSFYVK